MLTIHEIKPNIQAVNFCKDFLSSDPKKRYVVGKNEYSKSIISQIEIEAIIDDFTTDTTYLDKPIIKTENIPSDSLVIVAVTIYPFTIRNKLSEMNIRQLDYFAFYEHSNLDIIQVKVWASFRKDFKNNKTKYLWVDELLADAESKRIYNQIINFRLSGNLAYMEGFTDRQKQQYFEDFLDLKNEIFADVGGFDGFTSLEFIKKYPDYKAVYIFEPELENMEKVKANLAQYPNINFIQQGLSNKKQIVKFSVSGSASTISENGTIEIQVDELDQIVNDAISFIKMDIEGAEGLAIEGAKQTILKNHPKLAISVYHKANDFWKIPEQVLSIRNDYDIYLRHYTEGVDETVMFFVPNNKM
ncbi:FkbM family methyltransferase [Candidatus Halobeggiatoa sp. HSG11]|nr:FkbM family methyltransferase [Candidatus Halobeggiatoa sp. HSG11]